MSITYDEGRDRYKNWIVTESDLKLEYAGKFETIFNLGNGYMGLRAATEESYSEEVRGCYVAGVFDEFPGEVTELANIPDWLNVKIILDGEKFDLNKGSLISYNRRLNMKDGQLVRDVEWESPAGKRTQLRFERFVSAANLHVAALRVTVSLLNYSGYIEICSGINGQVANSGVQHFREGNLRLFTDGIVSMTSRTQESDIGLSVAVRHHYSINGYSKKAKEQIKTGRRQIFLITGHEIGENETLCIEKLVTVYTTRDPELREKKGISDKEIERIAVKELKKVAGTGYDNLFNTHKAEWNGIWKDIDILIAGPDFDQLAIRFSLFHIRQMTPAHDEYLSIAAKGLSGEGYKGHVFWDTEVYLLPFYIYTSPEIAKKLLLYRYHLLDGARKKARENGYKGAMFPWESADTGGEVTPKWGSVDIKTGEPIRIWGGELLQHITCDIVYGIWQYFEVSRDYDFMCNYGLEIMLETSRFWTSRLEYNEAEDRYEINDIMGPDEYSEHVNNNAFTNYIVKWQINKTLRFARWVMENNAEVWKRISTKLKLSMDELDDWKEIAEKIYFAMNKTTEFIPQYEGFTDKKIIDLSVYRGKIGAVREDYSWEDILQMQVLKQADVVMLLYLAGDDFSLKAKRVNWDYYEPKTLHDSSLSQSIHAIVAADMDDINKGYEYFQESIRIDLGEDLTRSWDGLHAASLGGNWQAVVNGFGGVRIAADGTLRINPRLPEEWNRLKFNLTWRGKVYCIDIKEKEIVLKPLSSIEEPLKVAVYGKEYLLESSKGLNINYR